jgi:hypothetical protein
LGSLLIGTGTELKALVETDQIECHNTVYGFGPNDLLGFIGRDTGLNGIDTNNDGWVDAKDSSVKVKNGSMTITFPRQPFFPPPFDTHRSSVTLVGVKRVRFDHFIDTCQDEGCLE